MRRIGWKLGIVLAALFLSGCGERLELEMQAFVVAIGLDKAEKENLIEVTFQISNPQVNTSQAAEAQKEPPADIVTITAPDLLSAKEMAQSSLPRKITFSHLETILIGEELARDKLFKHIIGSAIIDPEMRREAMMIVTKEPAKDFIKNNNPTMETRPHKYYEFIRQNWKHTGYVPLSNLNTFYQRTDHELFLAVYATAQRDPEEHENDDTYLAGQVPQSSGDPVQMMGSAILRNGQMIGTLDGEETRLSQLLRRKNLIEAMTASFPDPANEEYRISVVFNRSENSKIRVNTDRSPAKVEVMVPMKMRINSNLSLEDYTRNEERQKRLVKAVEERLEKKSDELVMKLQEEYGGEPFVWYAATRKNFWTMKQFEDYGWSEHFTEADVDIDFEIEIESFGEQIRPPSLKQGGK
ncbi:spore gernimation protein GerC [Bhargavaea cecembensis]|uniref:Spore gernimation protein GerC n=1 Tax=Bhargavaea cecembensis TaxID=394098 RepID=A0A161SPS6_9BACL|nr:Ger(x)C family spore germination protein [Bhargavaea cecembensis]KZE37160.1 spore gernimation protein GerC [Bhargavaea cecembensis]